MPIPHSAARQVTKDICAAETLCFDGCIACMALRSVSQYKQRADGASVAHETFPAVSLQRAKEEAVTAAVPRGPAKAPGATRRPGKRSSSGCAQPPHHPSFALC